MSSLLILRKLFGVCTLLPVIAYSIPESSHWGESNEFSQCEKIFSLGSISGRKTQACLDLFCKA